MTSVSTVSMALICVLLTTAAQIVLKIGVSGPVEQGILRSEGMFAFLMRVAFTPFVLTGLMLYVVSTLLWLVVLARAEVSFAYPFVSLGFVFIAAYAYLFMGESLSIPRVVSMILIISGVLLMSRS